MDDFYHGLKFDKTGIAIVKQNSKYLGKSTMYWVLYNKELVNDEKDGKDLEILITGKNNDWGFGFGNNRLTESSIKLLKNYIDEIK